MKKIYAEKKTKVSEITRDMSLADDDKIFIEVSSDAAIGSDKDFKKIKEKADDLGISVTVGSASGEIIDLAAEVGFETQKIRSGEDKIPVIDIIDLRNAKNKRTVVLGGSGIKKEDIESKEPEDSEEGEESEIKISHKVNKPFKSAKINKGYMDDESEDEEVPLKSEDDDQKIEIKSFADYYRPSGIVQDADEDLEKAEMFEESRGSGLRRFLMMLLLLGLIFGGIYLAAKVLPKADINMVMQRTEWDFNENITGLVAANGISVENSIIPVQIFKLSKNEVRSFPATEEKRVDQTASGKLTIYNAYSSAPQSLVKNTRFVTPDGKIYRLVSSVNIPGAIVTDGKIIPSSIETDVSADQTGDSFNVGPVKKLSIPGFKDTPKYEGFYGELKQGASGGFSGLIKTATTDDIAKAKEALESSLKDNIRPELEKNLPSGFKILEGTYATSIIKSEQVDISENTNKGQFSYVMVIEARIAAFKEQDILDIMKGKFSKDHPEEYIIKEYSIDYGNPVTDLSSGKVTIPLKFKSSWERSFDVDSFRNEILGKSSDDLKSAALSVPGINTAKIELWPFFVRSVPDNPGKVNITVD